MKVLQHLSAIAIITIIMALVYTTVQQSYRSSANDPQFEMAHDLKNRLLAGKAAVLADTLDLEKTLAPFVETFDAKGTPIQSTGYLHGTLPRISEAVLHHADSDGEHAITWQPEPGVRMALVIVSAGKGPVAYVASGRSLVEIEKRESALREMVLIAWLMCIGIILVSWIAQYVQLKNKQK